MRDAGVYVFFVFCFVLFVCFFQELKVCPVMFQKQDQNDIFSEHMGLCITKYTLNAIFDMFKGTLDNILRFSFRLNFIYQVKIDC